MTAGITEMMMIAKITRVKFRLTTGMLPNQKPAVEFRAFLKDGAVAVTETWSYTYLP